VTVRLTRVSSDDTEDLFWPGDELYFRGASRATNGAVTGMLTTPLQIGWGQTREVDVVEGVLFDGTVGPTDTVRVGFEALDEDVSKDWTRRPAVVDDLGKSVAAGLITLGPWGIAGAAGVGAGFFLMPYADPDDLLVNTGFTVTACGPGYETGSVPFSQTGWYSGWDYVADYEIVRSQA
jgi:hypothetical protein